MKSIVKTLPFLAVLLFVACAKDFYTNAFRSEQLIVSGTHASVHTYNVYYTNMVATTTDTNKLAKLVSEHSQVMDEARKAGACEQVLNTALESFRLNSADTNKTAVTLALDIAGDEFTNIQTVVKAFINPNNPNNPNNPTIVTYSPLPPPAVPVTPAKTP